MPELIKLPEPPEISDKDPQADVKKIRYQAEVDAIKFEHDAALNRETTRLQLEQQATIDRQKFEHDAALNRETTRLQLEQQATIDRQKFEHEAAINRETTRLQLEQQATIDRAKNDVANELEREKALMENEYALDQEVHKAYIEVAKGQIERATARAEFVQKAATAIGSAYTAILAFTFAIDKQAPLPGRGIAPTFFLGLAIALSTAYLSYLTEPKQIKGESSGGTIPKKQRSRRNTFILWTRSYAYRPTKNLLRASVICLGIGLIFLPAAYISASDRVIMGLATSIVVIGAVLLIASSGKETS